MEEHLTCLSQGTEGSNSLKLKHRGQDLSSVEVRATSRAAASAAASLGAKEGLDQLT